MLLVPQPTNAPVGLSLDDEESSHTMHTRMEVTVTDTSNRILDIIFEYALNKFNDSVERLAAGRPGFLSVIDQFVMAETPVEMCLPAFPFKSANKVEKVFGILPDKAEEMALGRLNSMCKGIEDVYKPGAKLTIISDGLVYNGLSKITQLISLNLGRLLIQPFCINRFVGHKRSRYLGLRRGSTYHGYPEGV